MTSTWNKAKEFLAPSLKIIVLIACAIALYFHWKNSPPELASILDSLQSIPLLTICFMLLLSLVSWLVESKKWQVLVRDVEEIRFRESVSQSLTAQAASFITPLRAGEFTFKALFFNKTHRKEILSRVFIGNLSQMIVTVVLGIVGLRIWFKDDLQGMLFIAFLIFLGMVLSYIMYLWIAKKWKLIEITTHLWFKVVLLSLMRYILFASNWILILSSLKSDISIFYWLDKIALNYLAVSVIPMFQLLDIPVKWTAATYIFNGTPYDGAFVVIAVTMVWVTNTLFPTLIGCALLPFKKLKTV